MLPNALYISRNISVSMRRRKFLLSPRGIKRQSYNQHAHKAASADDAVAVRKLVGTAHDIIKSHGYDSFHLISFRLFGL